MNLLFGTTSALVVTMCERFYASKFYFLYFAEHFNEEANPPSSNPFLIYLDYKTIFESNDIMNRKFIAHRSGVRFGVNKKLKGKPEYSDALATIRVMGIHGILPYLAMLDRNLYETNHAVVLSPVPPNKAGSPTSIEYKVYDIEGPASPSPEIQLERLY